MRFRRLVVCALMLFALALIMQCSDDSVFNAEIISDIRFPLNTGDSWNYELLGSRVAISPAHDTTTVTYDGYASIINEGVEKAFGISCYRMALYTHITSGSDSGSYYTGYVWLTESGDNLVGIASAGEFYQDNPVLFKTAAPGDEHEPVLWGATILDYPLEKGKSWTYITEPVLPDTKSVVGYQHVAVQRRKLPACVVQYHVCNDNAYESEQYDIFFKQYFTAKGLVYMEESGVSEIEGVTIITSRIMNLLDYKLY